MVVPGWSILCRKARRAATNAQRKFDDKAQEIAVDMLSKVNIDAAIAVDNALDKKKTFDRNLQDSFSNAGDQTEKKLTLDGWIEGWLTAISKEECELADHLYRSGAGVAGVAYTHHAIYIGDGKVIHYAGEVGDINVRLTTFEEFAEGHTVYRYSETESALNYSREVAVRRAKSRLGESDYNLAINNCENFVRWCRAGGEHF